MSRLRYSQFHKTIVISVNVERKKLLILYLVLFKTRKKENINKGIKTF